MMLHYVLALNHLSVLSAFLLYHCSFESIRSISSYFLIGSRTIWITSFIGPRFCSSKYSLKDHRHSDWLAVPVWRPGSQLHSSSWRSARSDCWWPDLAGRWGLCSRLRAIKVHRYPFLFVQAVAKFRPSWITVVQVSILVGGSWLLDGPFCWLIPRWSCQSSFVGRRSQWASSLTSSWALAPL